MLVSRLSAPKKRTIFLLSVFTHIYAVNNSFRHLFEIRDASAFPHVRREKIRLLKQNDSKQ
jgi:hypothetical protein